MSKQKPLDQGNPISQRDQLLRNKLIADIEKFENQLAKLSVSDSYANFAEILTLKELIRSRKDMLKRIMSTIS